MEHKAALRSIGKLQAHEAEWRELQEVLNREVEEGKQQHIATKAKLKQANLSLENAYETINTLEGKYAKQAEQITVELQGTV